jgi:hypothetical protein
MKRIIKHISILILLIVVYSCEKPAPTELVINGVELQDNVEINVIPNDPDSFDYTNGYDSTGITSPAPRYSSVVTVGSIRTSYKNFASLNNLATKSILAQAIFYDKSKPIILGTGKLVGYRTRNLGTVLFENQVARLVPLSIKIKNAVKDSVIGFYHLLYKRDNIGDPFEFNFNSKIDFKLRISGNLAVHAQIPTPNEIIATVETSEKVESKDLQFVLKWKGNDTGKVDIIIGGIKRGFNKSEITPFYNLKTEDDGKFVVPKSLLKDFPFGQFKRIVFTLIRQKVVDKLQNNTLNDNFIAAYSIHNIQLDIP